MPRNRKRPTTIELQWAQVMGVSGFAADFRGVLPGHGFGLKL